MNRLRCFLVAVLLAAALQACGGTAVPTLTENQVGTIVAQTMQALTTPTSVPSPIPSPLASPSTSILLPRSLYFLNNGNPGGQLQQLQIFRLERDGKTIQQITFEPANVDRFDVSPVDGSVVYISNNQMLWADASGAGRRVLVDGGAINDDNRFTNSVSTPVWSPDGKIIAFGRGGLNFYALDSGTVTQAIINEIDTSAGVPVVRAIYAPAQYSPDGTKLLINIWYAESGTMGIYDLAGNTMTKLNRPDGGAFCCNASWTPDSGGVYAANPNLGAIDSGLLYANASNGAVSILLPGGAPDGTYNFADAPLVGPDGKLYFFFNNLKEIPTSAHTPLYMARSAPDGVTGRVQLRPDVFDNVNEILWAPDASFAVVALSPLGVKWVSGSSPEYPDGRSVLLSPDMALQMKWGP